MHENLERLDRKIIKDCLGLKLSIKRLQATKDKRFVEKYCDAFQSYLDAVKKHFNIHQQETKEVGKEIRETAIMKLESLFEKDKIDTVMVGEKISRIVQMAEQIHPDATRRDAEIYIPQAVDFIIHEIKKVTQIEEEIENIVEHELDLLDKTIPRNLDAIERYDEKLAYACAGMATTARNFINTKDNDTKKKNIKVFQKHFEVARNIYKKLAKLMNLTEEEIKETDIKEIYEQFRAEDFRRVIILLDRIIKKGYLVDLKTPPSELNYAYNLTSDAQSVYNLIKKEEQIDEKIEREIKAEIRELEDVERVI